MELSRRQALLGGLAAAVAAPAATTLLSGNEFAKLICQTQPMKIASPWELYGAYSYISAAIIANAVVDIQDVEDKKFLEYLGDGRY